MMLRPIQDDCHRVEMRRAEGAAAFIHKPVQPAVVDEASKLYTP